MSNLVNDLKARCALVGTNITEVCKEAGVSRSVPERWKKELPKSLQILQQLENVIRAKESERRHNEVEGE